MDIKPIYIIIADISGYTTFIKHHKTSLIHAEHIISELLECVLDKANPPIQAHEILGDAVTFYAVDDGREDMADQIYIQVNKFFNSFRNKEAELISECNICSCSACLEVDKLKLKAILHYGEAAFGKIKDTQKISGENVILAHRLLKNSLDSHEYILMTKDFLDQSKKIDEATVEMRQENCEGIGPVDIAVKYFDEGVKPKKKGFWKKVIRLYKLYRFEKNKDAEARQREYRNIPA